MAGSVAHGRFFFRFRQRFHAASEHFHAETIEMKWESGVSLDRQNSRKRIQAARQPRKRLEAAFAAKRLGVSAGQ